jgi:hypothetical protein
MTTHWTNQQIHEQLILPRTISLGMILVLGGVTFGFGLVVYYALEGTPLMGNFRTVAGEPLLAVVAAAGWPVAVVAALILGPRRQEHYLRVIETEHPELRNPTDDSERLIAAFAAGRFLEYGILWGYGLACAILFHLLVSSLLPGLVVGMMLVMALRYPRTAAAVRFYQKHAPRIVSLQRSPSAPDPA